MKKLVSAAVSALALVAVASAANAAVVVGSYSLDSGTFGGQLGVHSSGSQSGTTSATGYVNQDNSAVTFTSTGLFDLSVNGSGEATVVGDPALSNLTVTFEKKWGAVTFDFETFTKTPSTMSLLVNGTALFSGGICGSLCDLGNGSNKFVLIGPDIQTLAFSFDPGIEDAKQFRLQLPGTTSVPEPATWAMMILGFGAVGFALRRRRHAFAA